MVSFILWAFMTWVPTADPAIQEQIANEIVEAIRLDDGTFHEAMILASLARNEGGFASWVGDGSCNRKAWREAHPRLSGCDGGQAYGWFQLHPGAGVMLDGEKVAFAPYGKGPWLHGTDLLADPVTAARIALRLVRYSLHRTGDLRLYTGERAVDGRYPKALYRVAMAEAFEREHLFYDLNWVAW